MPNGKYKQLFGKNAVDWEKKKSVLIDEFYNSNKLISKEFSKATFGDMSEAFLLESESYKVQTYIRRKRYWVNHILPYFKDDVISNLSSYDIDRFYKSKEGDGNYKLVLEIHNVLNAFFKWNIENNYCLKSNPISKGVIRRIRRLSKNQKFEELASLSAKELESKTTISLEEIKYTLREVRDTPQEIIYHLQIMTALYFAP